jgi:hypothetical protein
MRPDDVNPIAMRSLLAGHEAAQVHHVGRQAYLTDEEPVLQQHMTEKPLTSSCGAKVSLPALKLATNRQRAPFLGAKIPSKGRDDER